eukprot:8653787-Pyramimonas_sp.AAC.1
MWSRSSARSMMRRSLGSISDAGAFPLSCLDGWGQGVSRCSAAGVCTRMGASARHAGDMAEGGPATESQGAFADNMQDNGA